MINKKTISVLAATAITVSSMPLAFADTGLSIKDKDLSIKQLESTEEFKQYVEDAESGLVDKSERVPMAIDVDGTNVSGNASRITRYLPKDYDPRKQGKDTGIRNQENLGVCWAFAGIAGMESYMATNGYGINDLSEEHMRWWAKGGVNGWNVGDHEGTSNLLSMGYFASGDGPKLESELKYNTHNTRPSNMNTAKGTGYLASEVIFIRNNRMDIKNAITKYGGVVSGYGDFDEYSSKDKNAYYVDYNIGQNHAVTVVGWDDSYSREHFTGKAKPKYDGAWLVKNSWGNYNSEGGYFWVSYEDKTLLQAGDNYSIKKIDKSGNKIYQLEKGGYTEYGGKNFAVANVFNFNGQNETIEGVTIGNTTLGSTYQIYYAPVKKGVPQNSNLKLLASGTINETGYITIPVNSVKIPSGKGAIVVKMKNPNTATIFAEGNTENVPWFKAKANRGESFQLVNGRFIDINTQTNDNINFAIKAITKSNVNPNDIIGTNRYDTAVKTSKKGWNTADTAIISNGSAIVDALAATPLAAYKDAPVLLTEKDTLKDVTKNELKRLGVGKVYIIGGSSVISKNVQSQIEKMGISVERISGSNRYATSVAIANEMKSEGANIDQVAVVNGVSGLADAISFGAAAGQKNIPIILSDKNGKTTGAEEILSDDKVEKTYIIGGKNAVPESVESSLKNPERVSGSNRSETNAAIIKKFYNQSAFEYLFVVKDGSEGQDKLIDGLSVGAFAAKTSSPIILAGKKLSNGQKSALSGKSVEKISQVGGGSNATVTAQLRNLFK
ncbi:cell wall-binding repeat-containing protein [Peptacetobacter sp. AB845]|uniref:cell wall-binding repeat-containing protein n=1 Tax=Peptacetobacter sp. AB845 TaxID=3388429 RepID=UPI0039C91C55